MKIIINEEEFEIFDNDDDITILERYSLRFENSKPSLPSYFRIVTKGKDLVFEENLELEVEDVRDEIEELKQHDLIDIQLVQDILNRYPRLQKKELGFLWLISHPKKEINLENFKPLDRYAFSSLEKLKATLAEYKKDIQKFNELRKGDEKKERSIFKKINSTKPVKTEPFDLEEISMESVVVLEEKENILDIFDAMAVSRDVPFIALVYKKKRFFKIYTQFVPPDSWIETSSEERSRDGLYLKILNAPASKLSSKKILLENLYANGFWSLENSVYFTFKIRDKGAEDKIRNKIFDTLGDRLKWDIQSSKQLGIKGTFLVKNIEIERYVFADLIFTDELFKRFLYLDERSKTVMNKLRLFVHYTASLNGISLGVTITSIENENDKSLSVRVSGAQNFQQANAVASTFSKLLTIYKKRETEIKELYESIVPKIKRKKASSKKAKVDTKTGRRAMALKLHNPGMFRERYPDQCQKQQQPEVITKEEADAAIKKFVKDGMKPADATHKVMFFEGSYFICDPRDRDDIDHNHTWPGLKRNKSKKDPAYIEEFPMIPCCYIKDQYTKKSGLLKQYMERASDDNKPKKEGNADHILGSNKMIPPGRFGEMSLNWTKIFKYLKIKKIEKGKSFYPILRFGVIERPDSFIHCLEKAFNSDYSDLSHSARIERVMEIRTEISNESFEIAKQEMFDYTSKSITDILLDQEHYIAPEIFISLLEKYYDCNIFLFVVNSEFPNGNILIPRNSQAYMMKVIDDEKPFILINKHENIGKDIPYQCELISSLTFKDGKMSKVEYKFKGTSKIGDLVKKMFYESNEVFIVDQDGYELYKPLE